MLVELHVIQNFPPSCLNRDDTNAPKDCVFGGFRRARVSSQCLKRAMRRLFNSDDMLSSQELGSRTLRAKQMLRERLIEAGLNSDLADQAAAGALQTLGLKLSEEGETQYLLFLGIAEVNRMASVVVAHVEEFAGAVGARGKAVSAKTAKELASVLGGGTADLALFGRMVANAAQHNVDAAAQVAHAISTHRVTMEFDFFTAVDDLKQEVGETGAGMMGTVQFDSACFYRYANVDLEQLKTNLGTNGDLLRRSAEAFVRAFIQAIPSGKQSTMAAYSPPDAVLAVVRDGGGPCSLANAFVRPVRATEERDLVQASVEALDTYWGRMIKVYGDEHIVAHPLCLVCDAQVPNLGAHRVKNIEGLINNVLVAARLKEAS